MGRKPKNKNHLAGLRRRMRNGKVWFYFDVGGKPRKEIPLGDDFIAAVAKWSELSHKTAPQVASFELVSVQYLARESIKKSPKTHEENLRQMKKLSEFFGTAPDIAQIRPTHVQKYIDKHVSRPIAANREVALLSSLFNWSRRVGYTDAQNPCAGMKKHRERPRKVYITDEEFARLHAAASPVLSRFVWLMYLTAQRPEDVRALTEANIKDGVLTVTPAKTSDRTGRVSRILVQGRLARLIEEIREIKRGHDVYATALIVGAGMRTPSLRHFQELWQAARTAAGLPNEYQLRDVVAKATTDIADLETARKVRAHSNTRTTEIYRRDTSAQLPVDELRNKPLFAEQSTEVSHLKNTN
jgi:integrase